MSVYKKNKPGSKYIATLFLLLTLTACSTVQVGRDFDLHIFESKAMAGETKKEQVRNWLGKPNSTGISQESNGERLEEWGYFYGAGKLPNMTDAKLKTLQIRFDKKGLLRSYNWADSK
jgi:outer membrane protein assembly factor BamE (lipoprotein component of BamABCDE complex)